MAFNVFLADRIRQNLNDNNIDFLDKKMMGGLVFMVNNKMCVGIVKDDLMVRVGKKKYEEALTKDGCRKMDFTGKPMAGYVFVSPDGIDMDKDLNYWLQLALDFNKELTK